VPLSARFISREGEPCLHKTGGHRCKSGCHFARDKVKWKIHEVESESLKVIILLLNGMYWNMKKYIGIDLGGTNLRACIVDLEAGKVIFSKSIQTLAREGHEAVLSRMAALVEDVISSYGLTKDQVGGIGVGVPRAAEPGKGYIRIFNQLSR
jgi:uncharacterized 2Fe-2S/4Fe-4S cluster protein (DUF4445 family)